MVPQVKVFLIKQYTVAWPRWLGPPIVPAFVAPPGTRRRSTLAERMCQPSVGAEPPEPLASPLVAGSTHSLCPVTFLCCKSVGGAFAGSLPPGTSPRHTQRLTMKYSTLHYRGTFNINQIYCWALAKPPYVRASASFCPAMTNSVNVAGL